MKTSLAQTFQDIASGIRSKDRIFPARVCTRVVKDENGADLPKDSVLVVRPYEETLGHSAKTSTLLVNPALRKEYENLHTEIDAAKDAFLKAMKEQSGSKRDLEKEISLAFTPTDDKFHIALNRIKAEVAANGLKAVEAMTQLGYSLVLMDCQMPEMDGFEATAEIRKRDEQDGTHTPVIAVTAHAMKGDRERCLAAGMDDYVSKPVRSEDLKAALERWLLENGSIGEASAR